MLETITKLLYAQEHSIFTRLGKGNLKLSNEEENLLLEFSKEVNRHMAEEKITPEEICTVADIIYYLSQEPTISDFTATFYENVVSGIAY